MNFCPNCGNKISSRAKFCPRCGAPIASHPHLENDSGNSKGNSVAIILLGIVAALLVGGVATYFIINHFSKKDHNYDTSESSDTNDDATTSTMSQDDVIAFASQSSSSEEEMPQQQQVQEEPQTDVVNEYPEPERAPSPAPIADVIDDTDAASSGYHNMNPNSRTHHHLVGYMTDSKGDHAIELDFDQFNGQISNVVYKNVKYGGIIRMKCKGFYSGNILLEGKDGPKKFTMNLNYNNYGEFSGYSMVGNKELTVKLIANCNHN